MKQFKIIRFPETQSSLVRICRSRKFHQFPEGQKIKCSKLVLKFKSNFNDWKVDFWTEMKSSPKDVHSWMWLTTWIVLIIAWTCLSTPHSKGSFENSKAQKMKAVKGFKLRLVIKLSNNRKIINLKNSNCGLHIHQYLLGRYGTLLYN